MSAKKTNKTNSSKKNLQEENQNPMGITTKIFSRIKTEKKQSASRINSPSSEQIQKKAYEIWEKKGRPENSSLANWIQAEKELTKNLITKN